MSRRQKPAGILGYLQSPGNASGPNSVSAEYSWLHNIHVSSDSKGPRYLSPAKGDYVV